MMQDDLYQRRVGNTVLAVRPVQTSNLRLGMARANSGYDTAYAVIAYATTSRQTVTLGKLATLALATEYVDAYSRTFGLISKG
jgi:hypothetical protein